MHGLGCLVGSVSVRHLIRRRAPTLCFVCRLTGVSHPVVCLTLAGATFDGFDSPGGYSVQLAAQAAAEEEDDTLDVLQSLAALSRQLVAVSPLVPMPRKLAFGAGFEAGAATEPGCWLRIAVSLQARAVCSPEVPA